MTLSDRLAHCEQLHLKNIDMGLERVCAVAERMQIRFACPVITVAGTYGTVVDATIVGEPSSTKNADKARDPEMH